MYFRGLHAIQRHTANVRCVRVQRADWNASHMISTLLETNNSEYGWDSFFFCGWTWTEIDTRINAEQKKRQLLRLLRRSCHRHRCLDNKFMHFTSFNDPNLWISSRNFYICPRTIIFYDNLASIAFAVWKLLEQN